MDRLEKALEKARQLREVELINMVHSPGREQTEFRVNPAAFTGPVQQIDEAQLERRRILAHRTRSREADIFRILRTKVLQEMQKSGARTLGITSPNYGDGKTTIALNLAISIAQDMKQTVLLVDLDLRKPSLHEYLDVVPTMGLSDYLLHNAPIQECFLRPSIERLNTLPAGRPLDNSSELLGSHKMAALAQELRTRYPDRIIIYDMPPVLAQDDPIAFTPHIDSMLVVVRDGHTKIEEVKQCLDALSKANVIGTVLNNVDK
jgi:capsular exopolysaccharide synthesis family protein